MSSGDIKVRDIVFPLILAEQVKPGESKMVSFLGTGFLVGSDGYALTASHVVDLKVEPNQAIVGLFVDKATNKWQMFNADRADTHPTEDVTLLKMRGWTPFQTDVRVSFDLQFASFEYQLFGYPNANLYENVDARDASGAVLGRPDLIYSKGHIRRRTSFALPGIKGKQLYELSQPVGAGCSGSPVFQSKNGIWEVAAIYIADKTETIAFETLDNNLDKKIEFIEIAGSMSYAVRMDALKDWVPANCGKTLDKLT
ncbi:S1 family peptidase [Vibrio sp. OPT20]|uniref:S1 family peptidase n=1 Tax=Vibrio sp. OPT20 TaxID=2778642 RepID=UPI00105844D1|nr:serine protease [Vibrio sp. OPT20]MBE8564718.1 trypsin-like peptidase domain-containing protein [Vibrio sp. OPT20]